MNSVDQFDLDVLREAFLATSDEMFVAMQRASQSPLIYEVLDFAVGLTDRHGELVSQGNGVAGFLGPLGDAVRDTLKRVHDLAPGDIVATNDPFAGGGTHLSDVALVRPLFEGARLMGFAVCKGHWTELGGKDPGSWSADSTEVFQEGLQLPFVKVVRRGTADRDLLEIASRQQPVARPDGWRPIGGHGVIGSLREAGRRAVRQVRLRTRRGSDV